MTIASPPTNTCPPWCNDHQLKHLPDGRVDVDYHLHPVDQFVDGGVVEVVQEFDRPTTILWGNEESSDDPEYVRRLGRALIAAADTMEQVL